MAIAYDNSTKSWNNGGNVNSLTFSHTCSAGSNRVLLVFVYDGSNSMTGVTYGGVSMTRVINYYHVKDCWYLVNPASGANNVVISRSSTVNNSLYGGAISYTGCNTSSPIGNSSGPNTATDSSTIPHYDFTTANANSMILSFPWGDINPTLGVSGTGHTERITDQSFISGGTVIVTEKVTTTAGEYTLNYTSNKNASLYCAFIELKEAPPVVAPTVTTQAATDIATTSCTGNGNITATGGANATRRGFCYKEGTSGDPTTSDSVAYDDGSFGTGAFTKSITGLTAGTSYRVRAYAVNSAGTSYGTTVDVKTLSSFIPRTMWF